MFIMRVPRWIARTLLAAAAVAGLALGQNHTNYPCTADQVGAGGMCVTVQYGGAA